MSSDPLLTSRDEEFTFQLLNLKDEVLGTLDGVQDGGQLDFSTSAEIRGSGNIDVQPVAAIDWLKVRVRISYRLGQNNLIPLITAIPKAPGEEHSGPGMKVKVDLYDKLLVLSDDSFGASYGLPAGTVIIDAVAAVIASTGETALALTESSAVLSSAMVWDASTSKLRIVNDLLAAAGYFSLFCDGLGRYRALPYVAPSARGVSWAFADDENGLYKPEWSRFRDVFSVPNRYICVGRTEGEMAAAVEIATDTDPDSPFSYTSRGRWITRTDTDVEYADSNPSNLLAIAQRRLVEAQQISESFEIQHPWLQFGLNDVVSFTNERMGRAVPCVVQKQSVRLSVGGLVTSTLKAVV